MYVYMYVCMYVCMYECILPSLYLPTYIQTACRQKDRLRHLRLTKKPLNPAHKRQTRGILVHDFNVMIKQDFFIFLLCEANTGLLLDQSQPLLDAGNLIISWNERTLL